MKQEDNTKNGMPDEEEGFERPYMLHLEHEVA
jgi:hypothetical protein